MAIPLLYHRRLSVVSKISNVSQVGATTLFRKDWAVILRSSDRAHLAITQNLGPQSGRERGTTRCFSSPSRRTSRSLRGLSVVIPKHSTESFATTDRATALADTVIPFDQLVAQSLMETLSMVVREIRRDSSPQGSFAEENHPVETLGFYGKNESLGVRVQIGTPRR